MRQPRLLSMASLLRMSQLGKPVRYSLDSVCGFIQIVHRESSTFEACGYVIQVPQYSCQLLFYFFHFYGPPLALEAILPQTKIEFKYKKINTLSSSRLGVPIVRPVCIVHTFYPAI